MKLLKSAKHGCSSSPIYTYVYYKNVYGFGIEGSGRNYRLMDGQTTFIYLLTYFNSSNTRHLLLKPPPSSSICLWTLLPASMSLSITRIMWSPITWGTPNSSNWLVPHVTIVSSRCPPAIVTPVNPIHQRDTYHGTVHYLLRHTHLSHRVLSWLQCLSIVRHGWKDALIDELDFKACSVSDWKTSLSLPKSSQTSYIRQISYFLCRLFPNKKQCPR